MRQLLQSLRTGDVELVEAPCPSLSTGHVLVRTRVTLISAGTEKMLVQFGKASLLQKARQQPERVREVLDKARTDGLLATIDSVRTKLDEPLPLGYCNVGTIVEVGEGVEGLSVGDRVVSNGPHAEMVSVPRQLCAKVPSGVADDEAVFAVLGAIGLQGMRLAEPTLGECFVVTGLGMIGLMTVQLLRANGCRVLGIDYDPTRRELARQWGAEVVAADGPVLEAAHRFSRGRGVDGVLIAASCKSDEPVREAAQMCRKRGRLVLVGVAGLHLQRNDFYEKELSFRVSCSYGPGRHDPQYEQQGQDYPIGFVRWTEQRNFEAVLDMLAGGQLKTAPLVTHQYDISQADQAYQVIGSDTPSLGVLLRYRQADGVQRLREMTIRLAASEETAAVHSPPRSQSPRVAVIGAGNFAKRMLIPNFRRCGAKIAVVASQAGLSAALAARDHEADAATADWRSVLGSEKTDIVAIATRHNSHAAMTCAALRAGNHVYVEKPLALDAEQLQDVVQAVRDAGTESAAPVLMVGFNRRFAPSVRLIAAATARSQSPKAFVMTVNAGELPPDHWCHDPAVGGGRVIGEACHFIDLLRFLCGHRIIRVQASMLQQVRIPTDKVSFSLTFADGSVGSVHYLGNGHRSFPKERLEVFCDGRVLQLDNYRRLRCFGWPGVKGRRFWRQDKGHRLAIAAFLDAVAGHREAPIPLSELIEVAEVSLDVVTAAETSETVHRPVPVAMPGPRRAAALPRSA